MGQVMEPTLKTTHIIRGTICFTGDRGSQPYLTVLTWTFDYNSRELDENDECAVAVLTLIANILPDITFFMNIIDMRTSQLSGQ
jgi:hypothetical protein